ncbi:hypothetical protein JZU46_06740, partial [bacterium]|nr:hypothetical protein [bacterium]
MATLKLASDLLPTKGADSATFGRTGEQAIIDHDGIYRYVSAGCAGFPGARQVTNIFLYSEDFSNANWTKNFVTRTTESILGPVSGNVTATKLTGDGTSNQHYLGQNVTTPQNNTYLRFSALVKKGTGRYVC